MPSQSPAASRHATLLPHGAWSFLNDSFRPPPPSFCRSYVEQSDIHIPEQTVHEACLFSARLRLPAGTPEATVAAFVEEASACAACLHDLMTARIKPMNLHMHATL